MTIEVSIAVIISILSLLFSVYMGLKGNKRTDTKDIEERTQERTREIEERTKENAIINVKLDTINSSNQEIKERLNSVAKQIQEHGDRLIKVEESLKSAWKRIDDIGKQVNKEDDE